VDSDVVDNSSQNDSNLGSQQSNAHSIRHQNNSSAEFPSILHSSFHDNNNGDLALSDKTSNSDEENVQSEGRLEILVQAMESDGPRREIEQTEKDVSDDFKTQSKNGSLQCGVPLADDPEIPDDDMTNDDNQNYLHDFPKKERFPDGPMCYEVNDPKFTSSWCMFQYSHNGRKKYFTCLGIYQCPSEGCQFKSNPVIPRGKGKKLGKHTVPQKCHGNPTFSIHKNVKLVHFP
jgi:hypothetical protein